MSLSLVQSPPVPPVLGRATPRIATRRPRGRSAATELIRWATEVLDLEPLEWQKWALRQGLVRAGGRWASRTVTVLVARQQGKTTLATIRALGGMVLWGEQVIGAAQNRDIALEAWREALAVAEDAGLDVHGVARTNGREEFWIGRQRYKIVSSTRRGGRGLRADLVILDELREYRDWDGWSALEKTRRARPSTQVWAMSTEGDEGSMVLNALAAEGRAAAEAGTPTDAAFYEWSAPPGADRHDPAGWAAANPELGGLIAYDTILSESLHDAPEVFETEVLCRRVPTLRPWLPAGTWEATASPGTSVPDGAEVVFSLAAGPELRHATIGVGHRRPDGRIHVEAVAAFGEGEGPVLSRAAAFLVELVGRWSPTSVAVTARSPAEAAVARALAPDDTEVEVTPMFRVTSPDTLTAANAFFEAVMSRAIVHPPDAMTAAHLGAVTSDGVLTRRSAAADIDGAVALVLAHHAVLHGPRPEQAPTWMAF